MSESANRATLEALVAALNASDLEGLDKVFTDDVVMEWPQSGERIVGGHEPARGLRPLPVLAACHAATHDRQR